MIKGVVCYLDSLDDEKVTFSNTDNEQYVVDIDTYMEKKVGEIKIGDRTVIVMDGRQENPDGSFTPNVISIEYREKDVRKMFQY